MNVLIFGKGYLGQRFADSWDDAVLTDVRIDDAPAVGKALDEHKPDAVLNAAGKTGRPNVDWCETHQAETFRSNVIGPLVLAEACLERGIYLLHVGSGCIFYGASPDPRGWREYDFANPSSFYSRTKYSADLILSRLPNVGIGRIRMPIDSAPHPRNLIDKLAAYKQIVDVENSVTVIDDLIPACREILQRKVSGVFHLVNPGAMRHRDLLDLYRIYVDQTHQNEWIREEDLVRKGLAQKGRSNCILQSERLEKLGVRLRPIDQALRETMVRYAAKKRESEPKHEAPFVPFVQQATSEMKGVIAAGGRGTRLSPLTDITNKHLLPIYNKPMILYPLMTMLESGIRDIILITGPEYAHSFVQLLGSGAKYGCHITYRIQDQPGGIAHALGMARDFVGGNNCMVHLGDNVFEDRFPKEISDFKDGAVLFYKQVEDARRYGVVEVGADGMVKSIEEKPKEPKSNFAQTGLYLYDNQVFDIIQNLKPSGRGELEITDVNNEYLRRGKLKACAVPGMWFDAGTFEDLKRAADHFAQRADMV